MRQDPDIILVGEVRDKDTAEMAFRAAMTGHQVFTSCTRIPPSGAFPRLFDIGILPDICGKMSSAYRQRLVRHALHPCKEAYSPSRKNAWFSGLQPDVRHPRSTGRRVQACNFRGYRGRTAIMEILRMDGDLVELVAAASTAREIRLMALEKGFRPLMEEGSHVFSTAAPALRGRPLVDLTQRFH